ncbi:MAG TPA: radical SAM protein, partial [Longimicrobium sp.]
SAFARCWNPEDPPSAHPPLEKVTMLPRLYPFQSSLETIRAHHWRTFTDVYSGCAFNCRYCLYRGPSDYGSHVRPSTLEEALPASLPGILDIGAATDPYQPIEAHEKRTRALLQVLARERVPTFVLTRGILVTRDTDVLLEMAGEGLVEVCFSLITLREDVTAVLEPGAPPPAQRLEAAAHLAAAGIPVSFHVAPLIPGLDGERELRTLAAEIFATGATHIFTAMFGARPGFWEDFRDLLFSLRDRIHDWGQFTRAYPADLRLDPADAVTCDVEHAEPVLRPVREAALEKGRPFISENYAAFTTAPLMGGIYRWKLPTVYDMATWIASRGGPVGWDEFREGYYRAFSPSPELEGIVHGHWRDGSLFAGALVQAGERDGERAYEASDRPLPFPTRTLVTRKRRARGAA